MRQGRKNTKLFALKLLNKQETPEKGHAKATAERREKAAKGERREEVLAEEEGTARAIEGRAGH